MGWRGADTSGGDGGGERKRDEGRRRWRAEEKEEKEEEAGVTERGSLGLCNNTSRSRSNRRPSIPGLFAKISCAMAHAPQRAPGPPPPLHSALLFGARTVLIVIIA